MAGVKDLLRPALGTRVGQRARQRLFPVVYLGRAVESFDRPAWLYRSRGAIPPAELRFRSARSVGDADVALCQRLLDAYALARKDGPPTSGLWSHEDFQHRQRELLEPLQRGDPELLAGRLAAMFQADFVLGMAGGSLGARQSSRVARRLWCLLILNKLAALAESQGTARAENPEQGDVGLAFAGGIEKLVADTESALGVSLDFPEVGAAYGIEVAGRLITSDSLDQIYAAARIRDAVQAYLADRDSPRRVVEIGGGFGAMAYWLLQMMDLRYAIVDLPLVNVLQGYFLAQAVGESEVSLYGETPRRVRILPTHALASIEAPFDVLVNKDSMPEIPHGAVVDYLTWARVACDGIFYSYNQEAAAVLDGEPQGVVPEIVARLGGFERLRRDPSWLRRGYAEEIYSLSGR